MPGLTGGASSHGPNASDGSEPCDPTPTVRFLSDAGERTRTSKGSPPPAPKAGVSTNSTTPAWPAETSRARAEGVAAAAFPSHVNRLRMYGLWAMSTPPGQEPKPGVIITHPNRDKPVVQATRATVIVLLLASAALVAIVTIGGWKVLQGAIPLQIGYIIVYLILAFYAGRWNRGVLPVSAALAVFLAIFALVAGPGWFARDKSGFEEPAISSGLLGLITLLIVPLQMLIVAFAMRGFQQGWNVELERRDPQAAGEGLATPPPHPA
jgi:hypothetical protein